MGANAWARDRRLGHGSERLGMGANAWAWERTPAVFRIVGRRTVQPRYQLS